MKILKQQWLMAALLMFAGPAMAIDPQDVKSFDEVFRISAVAVDRQNIEVSWEIEDGYYLYNNKFLGFTTDTQGVVIGEPVVPKGERKFDKLLGEEVVKFHQRMTIRLPLISVSPELVSFKLKVRSQGCLEDVLCYPPTVQPLNIVLPVADAMMPMASSSVVDDLFAQPGASMDSGLITNDQALQPDDAFVYEAIGLSEDTILVRFTAQPGYYLYRDKFEFRIVGDNGITVRQAEFPKGKIKDDPEFGSVEVFYGQIEVPVRINRPAGNETMLTLEADYQGCRDGDICYPPQSTALTFLMPGSEHAIQMLSELEKETVINSAQNPVEMPKSEQDKLAQMLIDNPNGALLAFFIAGLLLAFTPCVFPMVPILSGIIAGQGDRMTTSRAFWLSLVYVLAMAVTYTIAGVLAGLFGQNLQAVFQNPWILSVFILVFIALAMSMFGFFELQLPSALQTRLSSASNQQKGGSLTGVAVMGFLSALIVGPCVAPPLAAALIVIGASGSAFLGGAALFALSMGMGVPLIVFGVSAGKLVPRAGAWMDAIKAVFGVGLLALAIWMLERIVQGPVILMLWGVLAIGSGIYMGALERIAAGASGWLRLWKTLGLVLVLIGVMELVGAATGADNWMKPLERITKGGKQSAESLVHFERIKSLDDLAAAVQVANQSGQAAMLDFYADWCVECLRMERNTFQEPEIQALFSQIKPLQADVTANDETDQALMREYGIIGPPAILFFDRNHLGP